MRSSATLSSRVNKKYPEASRVNCSLRWSDRIGSNGRPAQGLKTGVASQMNLLQNWYEDREPSIALKQSWQTRCPQGASISINFISMQTPHFILTFPARSGSFFSAFLDLDGLGHETLIARPPSSTSNSVKPNFLIRGTNFLNMCPWNVSHKI